MYRMDPWLRNAARRAIGFMPDDHGIALYEAALEASKLGPVLEIGSYCGKSALYLAAGVRESESGSVVFSVDHHRGSEEHQPGEKYHDPRLADPSGKVDTLPLFRDTIEQAGVSDIVVGIVAESRVAVRRWAIPLGMLFIDGSHSMEAAASDYESWAPHLLAGGVLAIHDVFEDPAEGGRPPYEIFRKALESGWFVEAKAKGSLRVLRRIRSS